MADNVKKYCTPVTEKLPPSEKSGDLLDNILESVEIATDIVSDVEEIPGWKDRNSDPSGVFNELDSNSEFGCESNPKSIGCKVLGDQFIFAINGLIKDLETTKPPGYILAVGKLKGAIIKLQAGD